MTLKGFTRKIKPLKMLTDEQIEALHRGTLECLEETGIRVEHEGALKIFADHGCQVDSKEKRVRIPPYLVEECLRRCPSSFHLKSRDPKHDLRMGGNTTYFSTFPGMRIVDLDTWNPRPATKSELYDAITVLDALDNLHMLAYGPYFDIEGVPPCMLLPEAVASRIRNSTKITIVGYQMCCEMFSVKMAKVAGTEAFGWFFASPPLTYYGDAIEAAFRFIKAGFAIALCSGGMYGGSAPATLAGSTITNNAELMAGLVFVQLVKPGTRVLACDFNFPMDMRTGTPAFGAVESALHNAMFNQIWRNYEIPTCGGSGGATSSKPIDFQCGYEKAMSAMINALSGANYISLHGGIYGEVTWHPIQAVLDNDVAGWIGRSVEGVEVTDETLALTLIDEVGPIPGHYLNKAHTRNIWKKEQFIPKVADRSSYPDWIGGGKKDTITRAKERVREILATHEPTPLSKDQDKEIDKILEEGKKYYKKKGIL